MVTKKKKGCSSVKIISFPLLSYIILMIAHVIQTQAYNNK